jgi:hypothetical protein
MTLNIKTQKSLKYSDNICVGCDMNKKTGDEIISCSGFSDNKMKKENISIKSYGKVKSQRQTIGWIALMKKQAGAVSTATKCSVVSALFHPPHSSLFAFLVLSHISLSNSSINKQYQILNFYPRLDPSNEART